MATPQSIGNDLPVAALDTDLPDHYFNQDHDAVSNKDRQPNIGAPLMTPTASIPPTPGSLAGRKRSRGDIFANDEEMQPDGSLPTPEQDSFADGVTAASTGHIDLIHPQGMSSSGSAPDQMDVLVDAVAPQHARHVSRPSMSSRKSQRVDNVASDHDDLAHLVLPTEMREATTPPLIDEATRTLGISWTRMDSSESLKINQAAYNKFIQNHYSSLKDVDIWFENSALPGYLVAARNAYTDQQEFYLFSHDLLEARLVTRDGRDLLPRLQLLPAIELAAPGGQVRAETDSATASQNEVNNVLEAAINRTSGLVVGEKSASRGRSAEPAHRYRELLCTAHEMELD